MKLHQVAIATALATEGLTSPDKAFAVAKAPAPNTQRRRKVIESFSQKNFRREEKKRVLRTVLRQRRQLSGFQPGNKESEELDLGILAHGKHTEHEEILDEDYRRLDQDESIVWSKGNCYLTEEEFDFLFNVFTNVLTRPYAYYMENYCASVPQESCNACGVTYEDSGVYSLKFDCPGSDFDGSYLRGFEYACFSGYEECPDCDPICGTCNIDAENLFVHNQNCSFNDGWKASLGLDGENTDEQIIQYMNNILDTYVECYTEAPTSLTTSLPTLAPTKEVVVEEPVDAIETESEEESLDEPVDTSVKEPDEEELVEVDISGLEQVEEAAAAAAADKSSAHSQMSSVLAFVLVGASWCWMAAA